ncbi:phage tail sheath C-terminal domain-containing protein [uncultured Shewanella sp.]|uniref:phage tail sheath family protein n=1 Tax=uncultured Shewanella sp. TaxID=173975 RepID=UPI002613CE40|nr:phage tail sheath C-terminal domain-containing protein [uncultured Shewanella sp.]
MSNYQTPGIYIEEKSVLPPSIAGASTAIPAFIGVVAKNLSNKRATRITTLEEYIALFGTVSTADKQFVVTLSDDNKEIASITPPTLSSSSPMYNNIRFYFDNGGGPCYIVPVEKDSDSYNLASYTDALDVLSTESEPTLIIPVADKLAVSDYHSLVVKVLEQCNKMQDRFGIFDLVSEERDTEDNPIISTLDKAENFRGGVSASKDVLKYGAVYYPALKTQYGYEIDDSQISVTYKDESGADTTHMLDAADISDEVKNLIQREVKTYRLTLPVSSAMAGVYAKVDNERGVWKAPANVALNYVTEPEIKVTNEENGLLNIDAETGKSINVIRDFGTRGNLVWGARTLAGNDNEWRYVPVRRLFNYVEESINNATNYAVFEPNDAMLWLKLKSSAVSFLTDLWQQGALAGSSADQAFFVQVGLGQTMTQQDVLEGRCIIKIGLAAVRPAEFIIMKFTHHIQQ